MWKAFSKRSAVAVFLAAWSHCLSAHHYICLFQNNFVDQFHHKKGNKHSDCSAVLAPLVAWSPKYHSLFSQFIIIFVSHQSLINGLKNRYGRHPVIVVLLWHLLLYRAIV